MWLGLPSEISVEGLRTGMRACVCVHGWLQVATTYVKREEVVETKDLICEPMAKKTVWSCELSDNTLVYHKLKTTEEYEQGWAEFWPHVKAAHHRYRTHIAIS